MAILETVWNTSKINLTRENVYAYIENMYAYMNLNIERE